MTNPNEIPVSQETIKEPTIRDSIHDILESDPPKYREAAQSFEELDRGVSEKSIKVSNKLTRAKGQVQRGNIEAGRESDEYIGSVGRVYELVEDNLPHNPRGAKVIMDMVSTSDRVIIGANAKDVEKVIDFKPGITPYQFAVDLQAIRVYAELGTTIYGPEFKYGKNSLEPVSRQPLSVMRESDSKPTDPDVIDGEFTVLPE